MKTISEEYTRLPLADYDVHVYVNEKGCRAICDMNQELARLRELAGEPFTVTARYKERTGKDYPGAFEAPL